MMVHFLASEIYSSGSYRCWAFYLIVLAAEYWQICRPFVVNFVHITVNTRYAFFVSSFVCSGIC